MDVQRDTAGPPTANAGLTPRICGRVDRIRLPARYLATRAVVSATVRACVRLRVEGTPPLAPGPSIVCFNHLGWTDPFVLLAVLPWRPRVYVLGPSEADMTRGWRNRLISLTTVAIPVRPGREDMVAVARRVQELLADGAVIAVAGEGRIHRGEGALLPLREGVAFFSLRCGVPIVPCAINGTSRLGFGRRLRVRFGEPIHPEGRATQAAVHDLTERTWSALHELCRGYPDPPPAGPIGRWLTEVFNDWPENDGPDGRTG